MTTSRLIQKLITAFQTLPSIGPKTAQRLAFHLLEHDRASGEKLGHALLDAMRGVKKCTGCHTLTEMDVCEICDNDTRDKSKLCVVHSPLDIDMFESSTDYNGTYFVLMGSLSPIDGIGPVELGIPVLVERIADAGIHELILAMNPTVEGDATAYYIHEKSKNDVQTISRIAQGMPMGSEIEYMDGNTLSYAFKHRAQFET